MLSKILLISLKQTRLSFMLKTFEKKKFGYMFRIDVRIYTFSQNDASTF